MYHTFILPNVWSCLKIHVARVHKFKCDQCELTFKNRECLERHKEAKATLLNIDPTISPDKNMKLGILRNDEVCFAISDQMLNNKLLLLHSWGCWTREEHSCIDLPSEEVLENEFVVLNDNESNTRHTDIGTSAWLAAT